jgi:hypothetical protein
MGMACRAPTDCATRQDGHVFLYAFDLIELNGEDLRREAIERRKAALAKLLRHTMKNLKAPLSRAKLRKIGVEAVTTVRNAIQFLRRVFGRKPATREQDYALFFVRSGYEYYANARFAMRAQSSYVCGNLFHRAVEMLLKAGLSKNENPSKNWSA